MAKLVIEIDLDSRWLKQSPDVRSSRIGTFLSGWGAAFTENTLDIIALAANNPIEFGKLQGQDPCGSVRITE